MQTEIIRQISTYNQFNKSFHLGDLKLLQLSELKIFIMLPKLVKNV
jgi:hypothetical protein